MALLFVASFIGHVNIIDAIVKNNHLFIKDTELKIKDNPSNMPNESDTVLLVRPEDVLLIKGRSSPDVFPCFIKDIHYRGSFYEIDIKLDKINLKVIENKTEFLKKNWEENQEAFIQFKEYKIFEASEGHKKLHEQLVQLGYIE